MIWKEKSFSVKVGGIKRNLEERQLQDVWLIPKNPKYYEVDYHVKLTENVEPVDSVGIPIVELGIEVLCRLDGTYMSDYQRYGGISRMNFEGDCSLLAGMNPLYDHEQQNPRERGQLPAFRQDVLHNLGRHL